MMLRLAALPAVCAALALGALPAVAQRDDRAGVAPAAAAGPVPDTNPCHDITLHLKCPNLRMAPPSDLHVQRVGHGVRLLARNRIVNVGQGPLELRAPRGRLAAFAHATQVIKRTGGRSPLRFPQAGYVYWKAIPGQGHYWKYWRAARWELWTEKADGTRGRLVRTGPKLSYCFRDLERVRTWARTPRTAVYPACSQHYHQAELELGISPGWADVYPSGYHENWISITGLHGCYVFLQRADPLHDIIEQSEADNVGSRVVALPARQGSVAPRGCAPER